MSSKERNSILNRLLVSLPIGRMQWAQITITMKKLSSKIENAILIACSFGLLIVTLWNLVRVFANLADYSSTQVFDTILLTAILLMFQVAMVAVVPFNKD